MLIMSNYFKMTILTIYPLRVSCGGGDLVSKSCPTLATPWYLNGKKIDIYRYVCFCVCVCVLSHVQLSVTLWTVARQSPLSMDKNTVVGYHFLLQGIV